MQGYEAAQAAGQDSFLVCACQADATATLHSPPAVLGVLTGPCTIPPGGLYHDRHARHSLQGTSTLAERRASARLCPVSRQQCAYKGRQRGGEDVCGFASHPCLASGACSPDSPRPCNTERKRPRPLTGAIKALGPKGKRVQQGGTRR